MAGNAYHQKVNIVFYVCERALWASQLLISDSFTHSLLLPLLTHRPVTFSKATALTVALHMKRVDIARYLFTERKLHPIFCGSRDYPPVFLEYIEYGTFEFIPWLFTEGYA